MAHALNPSTGEAVKDFGEFEVSLVQDSQDYIEKPFQKTKIKRNYT